MNTILRGIFYLQLTAMLVATALPKSFAGEKPLPFHGSIQGIEVADVQFPKLFVDATASGNATHLGRFDLTYELEVDLLTYPFETFGSSVFTAANGDTITTDIVGRGTRVDPETNSVVEIHMITGGTGRFSGATGTFVRTYSLDLITGATSGSFNGVIVLH